MKINKPNSAGELLKALRTIVIVLFAFIFSFAPWVNAAEKPSASLSTDILSQYIWRGYALSHDSAVIQPSMTVSYRGFSANVWGNYDTNEDDCCGPQGDANWNETDFTFSYNHEIYKKINITAGSIYYSLDSVEDSFEVFGGVSTDLPWLTVGFTIYREVSHYPGWWLQFDLSRSFDLPYYGMSIDMGASFIYQASEDEGAYPDPDNPNDAYQSWHSGNISAALNIPLGEYLTVSPKIGYSFPLSGEASDEIKMLSWENDDNFFYGGVNITFAF